MEVANISNKRKSVSSRYQDIQGYIRIFKDISGYSRIYQDIQGYIRIFKCFIRIFKDIHVEDWVKQRGSADLFSTHFEVFEYLIKNVFECLI